MGRPGNSISWSKSNVTRCSCSRSIVLALTVLKREFLNVAVCKTNPRYSGNLSTNVYTNFPAVSLGRDDPQTAIATRKRSRASLSGFFHLVTIAVGPLTL